MKYALALAGGGTRGAFEVGVWQALRKLNIEVCAITGTSIGAVNGAVFASGIDGDELWKTITAQDVIDIDGNNLFSLSSLISLAKKVPEGGVDATAFVDFLKKTLDEDKIRQSGIDYGLCTYRVNDKKSEELFLNDIPVGKLPEYVAASACFPLFKHTIIDGVAYSDGGLTNNLPEDMLIAKGYDTIISVSVKGPGFVRSVDKCGINIIDINCHDPKVGVLEFDRDSIAESIKSGYYECMRVFGAYAGTDFSINPQSYADARKKIGPHILSGLESAAKICKVDPYREYTVSELLDEVLSKYKDNVRLKLLTAVMEKNLPGRGLLDALGSLFNAANAIVYLSAHKNLL